MRECVDLGFVTFSFSRSGVYTRVEPLNSGVPMVGDMKYMAFPDGRITHLAPLALAQRDSAWRRFKVGRTKRCAIRFTVVPNSLLFHDVWLVTYLLEIFFWLSGKRTRR